MRLDEKYIGGLGVRVPNVKSITVQNPTMRRVENSVGVIVDNPKLHRAFPRYCMKLENLEKLPNIQSEGAVVYNRVYGKAR